MPKILGYARVSTDDQSLELQIAALTAAGAALVFSEKISGTRADRPELAKLLSILSAGDTLVVTRIDRLARSLAHLATIVDDLQVRGVHLRAIEQPVDTSTASGKAFLGMLGVFAQFETELRRERQAEGIAAAKTAGKYNGRPKTVDYEAIRSALEAGQKPSAVAKRFNVSRMSVHRARAA